MGGREGDVGEYFFGGARRVEEVGRDVACCCAEGCHVEWVGGKVTV